MVSYLHIQDMSFTVEFPLPVGMQIKKTLVNPGTDFNEPFTDNFQEIVEIWNTMEESFQQVGYSLDLKVVGEGKRHAIDSENCLDKTKFYFVSS